MIRASPYGGSSPLFGGFAADSSEEEAGSGNPEQDRKMLTGELIRMERQLDQDIEKNDHYEIRYALLNLEMRLMPRMARLSREIDASLLNADQRAGERKFQKTLQEDISRMMYKAGARACLNPDETFYAPQNKCMPFGPNATVNPCKKKDQILYDGKNNEGACDCIEDDRQLVYYNGECHRQNVRGPCTPGNWLVMTNSTPTCEVTPANCTADGKHIHWSPDSVKVPADCHVLGQRGPCSLGQIVTRENGGTIKCSFPPEPTTTTVTTTPAPATAAAAAAVKTSATGPTTPAPTTEAPISSVWDRPSCSQGSYRSQNKRYEERKI
ncbi:hypothetical protein DAPPUDRAFT_241234 [Daphnia pulex]|uniref:DUF4789 domain-containing protein n=1 Tax=Daphnia pulex TaxID=6669 RepID=E9GDS0_DAPPU|nr:hypothetical protein DAPPUDRAFT_241234 [Daphnia pulex]|eukprot:EFX82133.1 hypothetical protein DAPPUDRAFT_241234 [Daphnia pulex]